MIRRNLRIANKLGLHARAASKFVELASGFSSHVELTKDRHKVNGKSLMGSMMLAASRTTEWTLSAGGENAAGLAAPAAKALAGGRGGVRECGR